MLAYAFSKEQTEIEKTSNTMPTFRLIRRIMHTREMHAENAGIMMGVIAGVLVSSAFEAVKRRRPRTLR